MAGSYQWITFAQAKAQLAQRLNDPSFVFWTNAECGVYIKTALRIYNCLTWTWRQDFNFTSTSLWNSLGSLAGSPRLRTITTNDAFTELEYMLMEPPSGGEWTGTKQFDISVLADALQGTRDDMIQVSNCNQNLLTGIPLNPNTIRTELDDSVIDVERVRYQPLQATTTGTSDLGASSIAVASTTGIVSGQQVTGTGIAYPTMVTSVGPGTIGLSQPTIDAVTGTLQFYTASTLYRDDTVAQEFYEAPLYQLNSGTPQTFSLSSEPPLSWQVDIPPDQPGVYEAVVLQSGAPFVPPADTLLGLPDDTAWIAEFGALAELLGREEESTDRERAAYCQKMYQEGLNLMLKTPWIMLGKINGQAVSCDSIVDLDRFSPEWDSDPTGFGPVIVTGGIDFFSAPVNSGVGITCLANAPVPSADDDFLQVSRSNWDTVLDFCQCRAMFKVSGAEFKAALELEKRAIQACASENSRLRSLGAYSDILDQRGTEQERSMNRFNSANKGK